MTSTYPLSALETWREELAPNGRGKQLDRDQRNDLHQTLADALDAIRAAQPKPRRRHHSNLGSALQAVNWVLRVNTEAQHEEFLRDWTEGDLSDWPEYLIWLDQQEDDAGPLSDITDPLTSRTRARDILKAKTADQLHATTCGTQFLASERAMRFVERHGWPPEGDMLDWISAVCNGAGSGFNLASLTRTRADESDDDIPF